MTTRKCSRTTRGDEPPHTGFGDCDCYDCWPPETRFPLADHGKPLSLWKSLLAVLSGVRLYGR